MAILVQKFSSDMPITYSLFSIFFAIALGVAAAFIRRFLSDLKKKYFNNENNRYQNNDRKCRNA